jgi:hypothetical protein
LGSHDIWHSIISSIIQHHTVVLWVEHKR